MLEDLIDEDLLTELKELSHSMYIILGVENRMSKAAEETAELSAALSKWNASIFPQEKEVAQSRILKELCDSIFTLLPVLGHLSNSLELRGALDYNLREVLFKNNSLVNKLRG